MAEGWQDWMGLDAADVVTGFRGSIIGHAEYLTGCDQFLLQPPLGEDGVFVEARWFDRIRVQLTDKRCRSNLKNTIYGP